MEEQINDTSNEVVETPSTPEESFEKFLTAEESSTDQPEAEQKTKATNQKKKHLWLKQQVKKLK